MSDITLRYRLSRDKDDGTGVMPKATRRSSDQASQVVHVSFEPNARLQQRMRCRKVVIKGIAKVLYCSHFNHYCSSLALILLTIRSKNKNSNLELS